MSQQPVPFIIASMLLIASLVSAQNPDELDVLYIGAIETPRAQSYEAFLTSHFASVRMADRDTFDPATVGDVDVVLLDWSQREVNLMKMSDIESPLGPREEWSTPTVLLGSAGLLIAGPWQTNGAYG